MEKNWRTSKPSLGQSMSHVLDTGLYADMTFTFGPSTQTMPAHKFVIMVRSGVLSNKFQDHWDGNGKQNWIDLPEANPESFRYFLEYLYTDDFEEPISMEIVLEVLHLANIYEVPGLISKSCAVLTSKINIENCVEIYLAIRPYEDQDMDLSQPVLDFIIRNIEHILRSPSFMKLDSYGLSELLESDELTVDETELFKAVVKWSEYTEMLESDTMEADNEMGLNITMTSESRKSELESMIHLIRFPLMGAEKFAKEVLPAKILGDQDVIDLLVNFNGGTVEDFKFSTKPRLPRPVQTASATLPADFKSLNCFDSYEYYNRNELTKRLGVNTVCSPENDLRFFVNTGIMIKGLSFNGFRIAKAQHSLSIRYVAVSEPPVPESQPLTSLVQYEITTKIYRFNPHRNPKKETLVHTTTQVQASEGKDVNVLLDNPLKIQPGFYYFINTSLNSKIDPLPGTPIDYQFCLGTFSGSQDRTAMEGILSMTLSFQNTNFVQGAVRNDVVTRTTVPPCQQSRLIKSIIYTIDT